MKSTFWIESEFSSAHFYNQQSWTSEQNLKTFGRCFTPYGHGHNYKALFGFTVPHDEVINSDQADLRQMVESTIAKIDHEHLNFVIPEFKTTVPTTENIALYLSKQIQNQNPKWKLHSIKLYESDNLWVELQI